MTPDTPHSDGRESFGEINSVIEGRPNDGLSPAVYVTSLVTVLAFSLPHEDRIQACLVQLVHLPSVG